MRPGWIAAPASSKREVPSNGASRLENEHRQRLARAAAAVVAEEMTFRICAGLSGENGESHRKREDRVDKYRRGSGSAARPRSVCQAAARMAPPLGAAAWHRRPQPELFADAGPDSAARRSSRGQRPGSRVSWRAARTSGCAAISECARRAARWHPSERKTESICVTPSSLPPAAVRSAWRHRAPGVRG